MASYNVKLPIFKADSTYAAWDEMRANARRDDTFVYDKSGKLVYSWTAGYILLPTWTDEVKKAILDNQ